MKTRQEILIIALFLSFILPSILTAQAQLSTTFTGAVGLEMKVDKFGHITDKIVGTVPDERNEVKWVDYMSAFVKINNFPLVELKENFTVLLTEFDGAPAHPSGNSNGYFFPDRFDADDWTFDVNTKTYTWHNILEYEIDERTHLVGGIGYKIFDPSPTFGASYAEDRPAYQFTNVGTDTVIIEPFFYERIFQAGGTAQLGDAAISDYDGIIPTSDDFVYVLADRAVSNLPYFRGVGYPYSHFSLKNDAASVLPTLQGSGMNYDLPDAGNPVNNPSEMTFQYDSLVLAPGQTGVYWLYPKVLKMENNNQKYPTNIDYDIKIVGQLNFDYNFTGTDVSINYSELNFVTNALTQVTQDSMKVTVVEITGGMIDSPPPPGIKPLGSRYWEVFYDTRRESSTADVTFTYDVNADSIVNVDSLTLLYRLDYDEPWQEWAALAIDAANRKLTASGISFGDIQFVFGEKLVFPPPTPDLVSIENGIDNLWYNPNLHWICDVPANYFLEVADNANFNNPIIGRQILSNTDSEDFQFTNSNHLQDSTTYYWRVRAFNDAGTSGWSEVWSFTISNLNWTRLESPTIGGFEINWNGVEFFNADTGYIVGGEIKKTIDGGITWTYESILVGDILSDIEIIDDTTIFVPTSGGFLLEKGNSISWDKVETGLNSGLLNAIDFPTRLTGYVAGGIGATSIMLKTEDGGATWNALNLPTNEIMEDVSFTTFNKGIVVGRNGAIYQTDDGGTTWNQHLIPQFNNQLVLAVSYVSPRAIYIGGANGYIFKSVDDGATWTPQNSLRSVSPYFGVYYEDFHFFDELNGYAVGSKTGINQVVLRTTDGGNFWGLQNSNVLDTFNDPAGLSAVHFPLFNVGYAVGYDGTIIKYNFPMPDIVRGDDALVEAPIWDANPGEEVNVPIMMTLPQNLEISSFEILLGGFQDKVQVMGIVTTDAIVGQKKWSVEWNSGVSEFSVAAAGADPFSGNGVLFYLRLYIPGDSDLDFIPIEIYSAIFDNGNIPITLVNGGINLKKPRIHFGDVNRDGQIRAFDASLILKYLTGYVTSADIDTLAADVSLDSTISALDASYILQFLVGKIDSLPYSGTLPPASGHFEFSEPIFGDSLKSVSLPIYASDGKDLYGLYFRIEYDESVLKFQNTENWNPDLDSAFRELNSRDGKIFLSVANSESLVLNGLFATLNFEILDPLAEKTEVIISAVRLNEDSIKANMSSVVIDFLSSVESESIPNKFSLEQNYPNPFNPSTTIKYSLPENAVVRIVIFNSLGEEMSELVNEYQNAGIYQVNFDASGLSSGIYFYRISAVSGAKSFDETKKLILLK